MSSRDNRMAFPPAETNVVVPRSPDPFLATDFGTSLMAKVLAGLFGAGATLALLTIILPHSSRTSEPGVLAIAGVAYVVAALLWWRADRLPEAILPLALGCGSTLITAVSFFSAQSPSPLIFFYLWVFLYSSYFFSTRAMVTQIAYVGVTYGALLLADPPAAGVPAWWLVGMGTLAVAATLVGVMRRRAERLIATLSDAALTDPLTGLANRRAFREALDVELERARRAQAPMTVLVGDLDNFKEVNDRCGHQAGDAVLQRVGQLLQGSRRDGDVVARVGGEEFALALPDRNEHGAMLIAERLRRALQEEFARDRVPITISFGLACHPLKGETASVLVAAADEALYAAKESGRNRTVAHGPRMPQKEDPPLARRSSRRHAGSPQARLPRPYISLNAPASSFEVRDL